MTTSEPFGKADFATASVKIKEQHTLLILKFGMQHFNFYPHAPATIKNSIIANHFSFYN